jgi:hypothetical protein
MGPQSGMHAVKKDNAKIMVNTFGLLLNDELKTVASCRLINEGQPAKFGANAAA